MNKVTISKLSDLQDRTPEYALVANVDLVIVIYENNVSVSGNSYIRKQRLRALRALRPSWRPDE